MQNHPTDAASNLRILSLQLHGGNTKAVVRWASVLNHCYYLLSSEGIALPVWTDTGGGLISPGGAATERSVNNPALTSRFFRVQAVQPLAP